MLGFKKEIQEVTASLAKAKEINKNSSYFLRADFFFPYLKNHTSIFFRMDAFFLTFYFYLANSFVLNSQTALAKCIRVGAHQSTFLILLHLCATLS